MNTQTHIVLTDSLERELLQAELDKQVQFPLDGVFSAAAQSLAKAAGKLVDMIHAARHASPKTA